MAGSWGWGGWVGIMEWKQKPSVFQRWDREARGMRLSYLALQTCTSNAAHYLAGVSIIGFSSVGLSTRSQDLCSWSNSHPAVLWVSFSSGCCPFPSVHTMSLQQGILPASFDINCSCLLDTTLHEHHPPWALLGLGLSKVSSTPPYRISLSSESLLFGAV